MILVVMIPYLSICTLFVIKKRNLCLKKLKKKKKLKKLWNSTLVLLMQELDFVLCVCSYLFCV